jgi:hypothetical protein
MKDKVHHYDLLAERMKGDRRALKLQAQEYKRRLKVLNGEGDRIKEILKESIPREIFDRTISGLEGKIQILTDWKNAELGRAQWKQWIPYAIAISAIIFAYIKK